MIVQMMYVLYDPSHFRTITIDSDKKCLIFGGGSGPTPNYAAFFVRINQ